MNKICSFGEILLRLSPRLDGRWIREATMPVYIGGAELNVAHALAAWQEPVKYCSALPDHYLSGEMMAYLRQRGIDTSALQLGGNRIGTYYLPQGSDLKHAGVIYDRAHSSFGSLAPGMLDWEAILSDCNWFHFSAITPALAQPLADLCLEALEAAKALRLTISVDLNYRSKLWQYGRQPVEVMPALVNYCDVVMGNIWAAESLLGIGLPPSFSSLNSLPSAAGRDTYLEQSTRTAEALSSAFPAVKWIGHTFRFDNGEDLEYYASLHTAGSQYSSRQFLTRQVVDKVGTGDCFMAGLIHGIRQHWEEEKIVNFAAAAAFGKLQEAGDHTRNSEEDVFKIMQHGN